MKGTKRLHKTLSGKGSENVSVLVSVVMPTYNCGRFITQAVDSVIRQTVSDWELRIVDDCSTDNTQEVIQPYLEKYPNIHYYRLPDNKGPAAARNVAIKQSVGKYIAFLDADDMWDSSKLEKQLAFMKKTGAPFSCTAYRLMNEDGEDLHTVYVPPKKITYRKCLRLSNPIGNLTAMYDKEMLGDFKVPSIKKRNDFALWLQILKKTPCCEGMDEVLGTYREGRLNSVSSNKIGQMKYHWQLYRRIEKHNVFRSLYELFCWAFVKGTGIGLDKRKTSS